MHDSENFIAKLLKNEFEDNRTGPSQYFGDPWVHKNPKNRVKYKYLFSKVRAGAGRVVRHGSKADTMNKV